MMKFQIFLGFLTCLIFYNCSQKNRINLPENKLVKDIESPDSSLKAAFASDLDNFPVDTPKNGRQYQESRSLFKGKPLPVINLAGNNIDVKPLYLSQLAGNITYLKIKFPKAQNQASTIVQGAFGTNHINKDLPSHITYANNKLIISGLSGVFLYSMNGAFLDTLFKNKLIVMENRNDFFMFKPIRMVVDKPAVDAVSGKIYLYVKNWEKRQSRIMEFQADFLNNTILNRSGNEMPVMGMHMIKAININHETDKIDYLSPNILVSHASSMDNMDKQTTIMALFSPNGDTLCGFKNNLALQRFASGNYRAPEGRKSFRFNSQYTFKQEYNDTVFRVLPPNLLAPCYVFNLGNKKLQAKDAYNPKINIDDKIYIQDFFETTDYIVVRLVLGFDCPNNRKADKVHFQGVYYNKHSGQIFHIPGQGVFPEDFCITNDIDGGLPFWPQEIADDGEMFAWEDGKTMKDKLTDTWFSKSPAPSARKTALKNFVKELKDDDCVIICVK